MGREGIRYDSENQTLDRYILLDNLTATTDPTVNDDADAGYGEGSFWKNTSTGSFFICSDSASGAAIWDPIVGGIGYKNPTAANSTATITPTNGTFYLSTSKLITIKTSANQKILPAESISTGTTTGTTANKLVDSGAAFDTDGTAVGDVVENTTDSTKAKITAIDSATTLSLDDDIMTSGEDYEIHDATRQIWGLGSGAAITLTVDPSSLNTGDVFEIQAENGESRVIQWDGTDLVKIGGNELRMRFYVYAGSDATGLAVGWQTPTLDATAYDAYGLFSSNNLTPVRDAVWQMGARSACIADSATLLRQVPRLYKDAVANEVFADAYPQAPSTSSNRVSGSTHPKLIKDSDYELRIFTQLSSGTFTILGDGLGLATALFGVEEVPW